MAYTSLDAPKVRDASIKSVVPVGSGGKSLGAGQNKGQNGGGSGSTTGGSAGMGSKSMGTVPSKANVGGPGKGGAIGGFSGGLKEGKI